MILMIFMEDQMMDLFLKLKINLKEQHPEKLLVRCSADLSKYKSNTKNNITPKKKRKA